MENGNGQIYKFGYNLIVTAFPFVKTTSVQLKLTNFNNTYIAWLCIVIRVAQPEAQTYYLIVLKFSTHKGSVRVHLGARWL